MSLTRIREESFNKISRQETESTYYCKQGRNSMDVLADTTLCDGSGGWSRSKKRRKHKVSLAFNPAASKPAELYPAPNAACVRPSIYYCTRMYLCTRA